jgi:hypothetical protein
MGELARWNLKVSRETDVALRTLLATRGGKKGDLSRFVEDAVNREVLRQTVQSVRERNAGFDEKEIDQLVTEQLHEMRQSYWTEHRR